MRKDEKKVEKITDKFRYELQYAKQTGTRTKRQVWQAVACADSLREMIHVIEGLDYRFRILDRQTGEAVCC